MLGNLSEVTEAITSRANPQTWGSRTPRSMPSHKPPHPSTHFTEFLQSSFCVLGPVLGAEDTGRNKPGMALSPILGASNLAGEKMFLKAPVSFWFLFVCLSRLNGWETLVSTWSNSFAHLLVPSTNTF